MLRAIVLQLAVTVLATLVAGVLFGLREAESAAIGGGVCIVPNALFALRLWSIRHRAGASFSTNFLFGELVKLVLTFVLLVGFVRINPDVHWPSLLIGLVLATQAVFFAFWIKN